MPAPELLGRLRRVRPVGAGGFATVWLYEDDDLDSPVAVKLLADNWNAQADIRQRFLDEARFLRRVSSEHVVTVHDVGETTDGIPYFVMTYANDGSVADLLKRTPPPGVGEVVDIVVQAAHGLAALHAQGTVHRDVTPQNLLLHVDPGGSRRVLVADLGVAKSLANASGLTRVVGTPAYMAPEQVSASARLDGRADVHALGAVAYHLLTGSPVRAGDASTLVHAQRPAPPSAHRPGLVALDEAILRAVEPDPAARWPDPLSFAHALAGAAAGRTAPPRPSVERRRGFAGVRASVWLLALVVLLLCFALGYWLAS